MIQDIKPHTLYNQFSLKEEATDNDYVVAICGKKIILKKESLINNKLLLPTVKDIKTNNLIYLFKVDDKQYFLLNSNTIPDNYIALTLKEIRDLNINSDYQIFALYTASHLNDWYKANRYCGCCGKATYHNDKERALKCTCGNIIYPKIMPAVIVGVIYNDSILITRYKTGFKHNALIAGFVEIGETAEECVIREVKEETGVNVKDIRYYKSQPWGIASDLLLGYFCYLDGDEKITMDNNELKYASFVKREDIILQPDNYSLTNEMMKMFKEGTIK